MQTTAARRSAWTCDATWASTPGTSSSFSTRSAGRRSPPPLPTSITRSRTAPSASGSRPACHSTFTASRTQQRPMLPWRAVRSERSSSPSADLMVTVEEIRSVALGLPRTTEGFVRGQVKFYIGRIVYLAISRDESTLGFAFPKEWRAALVESEPEKFSLPGQGDMRYHWVHVDLAAIDAGEMRDLVEDAWAFVVPKRVAEEY